MVIKKYLREEKIISYCISFFGFFPLLPEKVKGLPVVILIVFSLLFYILKGESKFNIRTFIKLSSLYLINLLSIFYSGSLFFPINKMETSLSLLIIPLSFALIDKQVLKNYSKARFIKNFILSTTFLTLISFYHYYSNNLFAKELFKVNSFRKTMTEVHLIGDHPIYISLFLGVSILMAIYYLKKTSKVKICLLAGAISVNFLHMLLLSSKGVIIATAISVIVLIFLSLRKASHRILVSLAVLSLLLASILFFPNMERRFREIGKKTTYTQLHINNSSSVRIAIYKCAIAKIKEKPLLGYGWGIGDMVLNDCYLQKSTLLYKKNYNSHNQYLGYYLDGGIIALIVLVIFLSNQFILSIYIREFFYSSIILLFTISMLTENLLNRQSGVILFIFLLSFFYLSKINK